MKQSQVCSNLLEKISHSLAFSSAVYEPDLQLAVLYLNNAVPGGIKLFHHQGFPQSEDDAFRAADNCDQVFLCAKVQTTGHLVVTCRGTTTLSDVLQDIKCLPARLSFSGGHTAHWGFAERADSIPLDSFHKFMEEFPASNIIFTGHSLGGAVASLLALRLLHELESELTIRVKCITFGAPLFASSSLAALVTARYRAAFLHVVMRGDCVPKLLPFISAVQRLVYDDDHWEGFKVTCTAVGSLFPVVSWIPQSPIGLVVGKILRAVIPRSFSYDYAGEILVLDKDSSSLSVFASERFNAWHCRLAMALGGGKDVMTRIHEHSICSYKDAIDKTSVCSSTLCTGRSDESLDWCCKLMEVERKGCVAGPDFGFGKVLGAIGRISRNCHAIQTMCIYTFAGRVIRSLFHRLFVVERAPIPF